MAVADADILRRAMDNLVDNALRYAKNIIIRGVLRPTEIWLEVADDGPGIPLSLRESIFDKYVQVAETGTQLTDTNRGLGLTFVKLAAQAHGGQATIDCPTTGGTTFRLTLPR